MLDLRPECERCHAELPPTSSEARFCAHGCTFCAPCTDGPLAATCPNCGGELVPRPRLKVAPPEPPPTAPRRLVCLSQETAETLALLGLEDRVVGVSSFVARPVGAFDGAARIGGFSTSDVGAIAALEPDLVLLYSDVQADLAAELLRAGLEVHAFHHTDLAGMLAMVRTIGRLAGVPDRGEALAASLAAQLEAARGTAPTGPRRRVYFEEWNDPLVAGVRWVSELIELAGGEDVFAELSHGAHAKDRVVEPADVVAAAPDVVLASWCGKPFQREQLEARPGWSELPAVRAGRVHGLDSTPLLAPGPGLVTEALELLRSAIAAD